MPLPYKRIGFTGHQGLTSSTEQLIFSEIETIINNEKTLTGICSLAEGSDQIFARIILAAKGELIVVVPCRGYEETFKSRLALQTYREYLSQSKEVIELDFIEPTEEAFWEAGKRVVEESDYIIAVWDGKPAGGLGGTADVVKYAQKLGKAIKIIWPDKAARA